MKRIIYFLVWLLAVQIISAQSFTPVTEGDLVNINSASRSANFIDVNGDGWDDIFISNGPSSGQDNMLYINNQDGTFTTITNDPIVMDGAKSDGATFGDADNDGDLDACVVTWYGQINNFFRGQSTGSFSNESNIVSQTGTFSETASWGDMDNDGWLDLYITNSDGVKKNKLFKNLGDGNFEEITDGPMVTDALASRSIDWIDYDNDGDSDLFITNESNQKNNLYQNDGNGGFTKITTLEIVSSGKTSAGSSWADIDNDGDFDLFVANYQNQNNQLFLNNGDGTFAEITQGQMVSEGGCSFGSSFADVDNDGDVDLFVCNAFCGVEKNFFYINNGDGTFYKDVTSSASSPLGWTFGCAWGDYNNDGFQDLVLANCKDDNQKNALFRNNGNDNNWFKLNCEGVQTNRSGMGTIVKAKATINGNPVWQMRRIAGQSGYNCQNSLTVHFGLGDAELIDSLIIDWGVGDTQVFTELEINKICQITQGENINCETTSASNITIDLQKLKIFPNPLVGDTLKIENPFSSKDTKTEIKIISIDGKLIQAEKISIPQKYIELNLNHLSKGSYQILLSNDGQIKKGTIVIP